MTAGQHQPRRQAHLHPMGAAHLAHFGGHRNCGTDDQQVVDHPQRADDHRADFCRRASDQAPHRKAQTHHVERGQPQVRLGDAPVELFLLHQAALGGDVERAFFGANSATVVGRAMYQASTVS